MRYLFSLLFLCAQMSIVQAQNKESDKKTIVSELQAAGTKKVTTHNSVRLLNGQKIEYTATTGYLNLKNDTGKIIAKVFFTYYKKDGADHASRPVCFTFNGGPGSCSVWLHMGGLGPRRLVLQDDGTALAPPYQITNNEFCWLDKTDLVFIDPIATGYSKAASGENPHQFHGYNEDIQSIGSFIRNFLTEYNRWGSPKFLCGESYGTTRASGMAKFLTDNYRIYLNGILLISPVLNFGTNDYQIGNDLPLALYLPSYTAAAFYHKKLAPALLANFENTLKEVEAFAINEYAPALLKGEQLNETEKENLAQKLSYYSGLSKEYILRANLRVEDYRYYKELLRNEGLSVGRFDARFTGRNFDNAGEHVDFDPSFTNIDGPFTTTINEYFINTLNFSEDHPYNIFGSVHPWNYNNVQNRFLNVAESLRDAMTKNTHLKVYVGSGYYDFATPYFTAKYDISHMLLHPSVRGNIRHHFYESGHMYYINMPSMIQFKKDIDSYFDWSLKD